MDTYAFTLDLEQAVLARHALRLQAKILWDEAARIRPLDEVASIRLNNKGNEMADLADLLR